MAGYSGTPLAKKLGLKGDLTLLTIGAPDDYATWLGELPEGVVLVTTAQKPVGAAHLFAKRRAELAKRLATLRRRLDPATRSAGARRRPRWWRDS